jgi:hypothetical protein
VVLPEQPVGKYQRAVFVCRINVLGGVVDGMCQQIDVVAPFLYVGNVLYVSFYSDIPVFLPFAGKRFEADIENVSFEEDAVVHAVFHLAFQILFHPAGKAFPVFRKDKFQIIVHIDVLHLFRTHDARMAIDDGGELIVIAPALKEFGEDREIDRLIRKYGYFGTPKTLKSTNENEELQRNLGAAAHLIHGSSEGRFSVTYCPGKGAENLSQSEIESVGFAYADIDEVTARYNPEVLKDGFNVLPDGEEIFYISNPALGLWAYRERFKY